MNIKKIALRDHGLTDSQATITVYTRGLEELAYSKLPAIIICPGGGYEFTSAREAEPMALAFLNQGYHCIVLDYTVYSEEVGDKVLPLVIEEVAKTFEILHISAEKWHIDSDRIYLLGCSAGGHLAASYGNFWSEAWLRRAAGNHDNYAPKGLILGYPVIDFDLGWPPEADYPEKLTSNPQFYNTSQTVNDKTPTAFVWHTAADNSVPIINSIRYVEALTKQDILFEAHFYEKGCHGLSVATKSSAKNPANIEPAASTWVSHCIDWLENN